MSGVTLLSANSQAETEFKKSLHRSKLDKTINETYWIVTTKTPRSLEGAKTYAVTKEKDTFNQIKVLHLKNYKLQIMISSRANFYSQR